LARLKDGRIVHYQGAPTTDRGGRISTEF
jgi:hypothetical protein